ncbi:hypothetical protein ACA910_014348 [Epithemia clementina (nom. ined.)]
MSGNFSRPTSPAYSPPTSPAYSVSELPGEPYIPTSPEYHPPNEDTHLDSDRSAGSQRDPDQGATVTDRDSNQGSNETTTRPVPPLRTNVSAIIRREQRRRRNGFRRLPAAQLQFQQEQQADLRQREEELWVEAEERAQHLSRINDSTAFRLSSTVIVEDPLDIQELCRFLQRHPRGRSVRRHLHSERIDGRTDNSDPILLLSFETPDGISNRIFVGHDPDYDQEEEQYTRPQERLARRLSFLHTRFVSVNTRSTIYPFAPDTTHRELTLFGEEHSSEDSNEDQ